MDKIVKRALIDSIGTAVYVIVVASFMYYIQLNMSETKDNIFAPIAMLLLFVFSAALTGILVFGKPFMLYLDGKKKDAMSLIAWTLGFLFVIIMIVFVLLMNVFR